jgi:hypothetical protein
VVRGDPKYLEPAERVIHVQICDACDGGLGDQEVA